MSLESETPSCGSRVKYDRQVYEKENTNLKETDIYWLTSSFHG